MTPIPESASVVVVGGGVIGCSLAFHLAQSGVGDVLLLDRGDIGAGSTCKAAGGVRASFSDPLNVAMGLRGVDAYSRFGQTFAQDVDFSRNGYLYLLDDDAALQGFAEAVEIQNRQGVPSRLVTVDEAHRLSPLAAKDGLVGALWSPDDARATPESVTAGYAASARRLGVRIAAGCTVTDVGTSGGEVTGVMTAAGRVATSTVVCAAGAWSRHIGAMAGVDIPVTPYRRVIAFTGPTKRIAPNAPLTVDASSSFYFHGEGGGVAFGWSDPAEPAGFDVTVGLHAWLEKVAPHIERRAPHILDLPITSSWAGLYEVTPDHNQIIGRAREVEGFLYATGFSGHGFLMAPATGEIVRDLYHRAPPEFDVDSLDVRRFDLGAPALTSERHII